MDWKNVYVRRPNQEERETGAAPLTQFGRMCAQLGIQIIPASSPQAKGRVERRHGTHQDRLVKKLRRRGIGDLDAVNAFLASEYWPDHNRRFARPPSAAEDFHRARPRGLRLAQVVRLEAKRSVSNDWVVRYDNRLLQVERQSPLLPTRSTVQVYEDEAGQLEIRYRDRRVRWTERPAPSSTPPLPTRPTAARPAPAVRQSRDHPWRHQAVENHYAYRQLAKDRRVWERGQP